jgi:pseudouridine-5'-phosphate glycosidase
VSTTVESAGDLAELYLHQRALGRSEALLVVQPPPADVALAPQIVEAAVDDALAEARRSGIRGAAVTPFLLAAVERATRGHSLAVNLALLEANARLAGEIAVALAGHPTRDLEPDARRR